MFNLATAKSRLSILPADTTKDAIVQMTLDASLALAETYCDRKFLYAAEQVAFTHPRGGSLQLNRFPIEQVAEVKSDTNTLSTGYHFISTTGQIILDQYSGAHVVFVTYSGGYKVLPPDLELALWATFDAVWPTVNGGGAVSTVAAGTIESVSIPDVGTVKFATGANAAAASAGNAGAGLIPAAYLSILDRYRNHAPIGVS